MSQGTLVEPKPTFKQVFTLLDKQFPRNAHLINTYAQLWWAGDHLPNAPADWKEQPLTDSHSVELLGTVLDSLCERAYVFAEHKADHPVYEEVIQIVEGLQQLLLKSFTFPPINMRNHILQAAQTHADFYNSLELW